MSDFWWGVLTLPLIAIGLAVTAYFVLGGWLVAEKWAEHRTAEHNRDPIDDLASQISYRRVFATWVLAAPKLRRFKLGYGTVLLIVRGLNRIDGEDFDDVRMALYRATDQLDGRAP